jgi:signal transduction histidine kinase/ActR/RegA family two-component response regulator
MANNQNPKPPQQNRNAQQNRVTEDLLLEQARRITVFYLLTDNVEGRILEVSDNLAVALGKNSDAIVGKTIVEIGLIRASEKERFLRAITSNRWETLHEHTNAGIDSPISRWQWNAHLLPPSPEGETHIGWFIQDFSQLKDTESFQYISEGDSQDLLNKLSQVGPAMNSLAGIWDLNAFCRNVVVTARNNLGFEMFSIWLYDENTDKMRATYGTDPEGNITDDTDKTTDCWDVIIDYKKKMMAEKDPAQKHDIPKTSISGFKCLTILQDSNRVLGVLTLWNESSKKPIDAKTKLIMEVFSTGVSYLLARLQGEHEKTAFSEQLKILHEIGNQLSRLDSPMKLLRQTVESGREKLGFDRIGIWLFDKENNCMRGAFGTDTEGNTTDEHELILPDHHWKKVVETETDVPYWQLNQNEIERLNKKYGYTPELTDLNFDCQNIVAPLWSGEETIGILAIDNYFSKVPIPNYRKDLLALYAKSVAHIYENLVANEALDKSHEEQSEFSTLLRKLNMASIELSANESTKRMCRQAIEIGLQEFGYERLSIWFYNKNDDTFSGTYGTDENGKVRDESHMQNMRLEHSGGRQLFESDKSLLKTDEIPLYGTSEIVPLKKAPAAIARINDGKETVGYISAGNFFSEKPFDENHVRLLALYASTIGHIYSHLTNQERMRNFGRRLEQLHHVSNLISTCKSEDELWRKSVECGINQLEFERMTLQVFNPDTDLLMATWGTDKDGRLCDERGAICQGHFAETLVDRNHLPKKNYHLYKDAKLGNMSTTKGTEYHARGDNAYAILWDGESCLGFLVIDNLLTQQPITQEDLEILTIYASTVAYQIRSKRTEASIRDFSERLRILHEKSTDITSCKTIKELCRNAVEIGHNHLGFARMAILLYDEKRDLMVGTHGVDINYNIYDMKDEETGKGISKRLNDPLSKVMRQRQPYARITETELDPDTEAHFKLEKGLAALWDGKKVIGYIPFDKGTPNSKVTERDLELLVIYANTVGHAISELRAREEKQQLESQIQHSQKLESLGVLAGGIAHDFNNLLMGILGNIDLALMDLPTETKVRKSLEESATAARRAAELARQMLAYSGKGKFVIEPVNINLLIQEMGHLLDVSIAKSVILKYDFTEKIPLIEADATQIRQIIMNLLTNASESIGKQSGIISITTRHQHCDAEYLSQIMFNDSMEPGKYVILEVSDSGCGMDQQTLKRIFEPFFTTKFTGRGLGMAAVIGIIRGHKGGIKVYSEPGQGSCFKVLLPALTEETTQTEDAKNTLAAQPLDMQGTILLVDDEAIILEVTSHMLEKAGFDVITAEDGRKAMHIFKERHKDIACVILDLTMPHMNGETAYKEISAIDPGIPVIMSSGYSETDVMHRFLGSQIAGFIEKPYQMAELIDVLSKALKKRR